MEPKDLLTLIEDAFRYKGPLPEKHFQGNDPAEQGSKLIKGIKQRNSSPREDTEGKIDLDCTLEKIKSDPESFIRDIDDFIAGKMKDKYSYALRFDHLIQYLNKTADAGISNEFLNKYKYKDADRRRLAILKYLHEDAAGKTQNEISEQFGIDEKTYREDIYVLMNGFNFMGTVMKITGNNKTESDYSSPVHPLFLALNTTQVWSLIVGSKLLSKATIFEPGLAEIIDMIYTQLSPLARGIIDRDSEKYGFQPEWHDLKYTNSLDYYRASVKNAVYRKLCHILRKGEECTIRYTDPEAHDEEKTVTGIISIYIDENLALDQIRVKTETGDIIVRISRITDVFWR